MSNMSEQDLTKAAELLAELQQQLMAYRTALDSIDGASAATQSVAAELEKLAGLFRKIDQSQMDLTSQFEETRRALLFTQQKTQQIRKDLDEWSQTFTRDINSVLQNTLRQVQEQLNRFVAPDRDILREEVKKLKFYLFLNIVVMFVLFFSAFMYFYNTPKVQTVERQPVQIISPGTDAQAPVNQSKPRVQVLNGCGVDGVAKNFVNFLNRENFLVTNVDNADNFNYANSIVYLNGDYAEEAMEIAGLLGIPTERILPANGKWKAYHITVIIGKDYRSLKVAK
jgi:hypothetical protein